MDLTCGEKSEILDRYRKLPKVSQEEAADRLGIKRGLLCNLLWDEAKIRKQKSEADNTTHTEKHPVVSPMASSYPNGNVVDHFFPGNRRLGQPMEEALRFDVYLAP